jgi:predicted Zn finger-like uncharacterized protein
MPIQATCPRCQTSYTAGDHLRGKKVRCKRCKEVLVVGSAGPPRPPAQEKADAAAEEPARPRRRKRRRSKRPLVIGLVAGGGGLILLAVGIIVAISVPGRSGGKGTIDPLLVDVSGPWPAPMPMPGIMMGGGQSVTLHVAGVVDEFTREAVQDRISALAPNTGSVGASEGTRMTVVLSPIADPEAFAKQIDFGTVRSVTGRTITVVAEKADGPPPKADKVTKALFRLKSSNPRRRTQAAWALKDLPPDDRRAEVARALEPLLDDPMTRRDALLALATWATKENVPALLKALSEHAMRGDVMRALARLRDERAIEPIAAYLERLHGRHDATVALQMMGPMAEPAVRKRLEHPAREVRMAACEILKVIGTRASIPALQTVGPADDRGLRMAAEQAIQTISARP